MSVKLIYDETNPKTLNKEEINEVQRIRLRSIIHKVYENSPYYHKLFKERGIRPEDIRSIEDLVKIPFTTKDDLRKELILTVVIS